MGDVCVWEGGARRAYAPLTLVSLHSMAGTFELILFVIRQSLPATVAVGEGQGGWSSAVVRSGCSVGGRV